MKKDFHIGGNTKVSFDMSKLKAIEQQIGKSLVVVVGVLGVKTNRVAKQEGETHEEYKKRVQKVKRKFPDVDTVTNADIGLAMEKGIISKNVPARSWLEQPLVQSAPRLMSTAKFLFQNITEENIVTSYKMLGIEAEAIIQEAFDTQGGPNNRWAPLKYRVGSPLIDTGQLRRSVTSAVRTPDDQR